ncbi:hypothetical protein PINS_up004908 [Pythium insidiosum]|nr:hypothetical protein PINS_up004908 [Pythium insidiosum]
MIDFRKYLEDSEFPSIDWINALYAKMEMASLDVQVKTDDAPPRCWGRLMQFFRRVSRLGGIRGDVNVMSSPNSVQRGGRSSSVWSTESRDADIDIEELLRGHQQSDSDEESASSEASTVESDDTTTYRGQEVLDLTEVEERLMALKSLLFAFGLAYPAGDGEMTAHSDLIFPAYWKLRQDRDQHQPCIEVSVPSLDSCYWKYEFDKELYPSTLFERLIVRSYIPNGRRDVTTPTAVVTTFGNIGQLVLRTVSNDFNVFIFSEARAVHPVYARRLARFGCMAIERLLDEREGIKPCRESNEEGEVLEIELPDEDEDDSDFDSDESTTETPLGGSWLKEQPWKSPDWNVLELDDITLPLCVDLNVSNLLKRFSSIHVALLHSELEEEVWSATADQHTATRLHAHNLCIETRDCILQVTCGESDDKEFRQRLSTLLEDVDSTSSSSLLDRISTDATVSAKSKSNTHLLFGADRQGHFQFEIRMDAERDDFTATVRLTHAPLCSSSISR